MSWSEEDLRTKVIYPWLNSVGISPSTVKLEFTFKIQLGKGVKPITGRSDILIRNSSGQSLFIIEVKKPNHKIDNEDKKQALSYAKALVGGIAPFTILTNGKETFVFDSITGVAISDPKNISSHRYFINGVPDGESIQARFEALKYLISLSIDNLLTFCEGQVQDRMRRLKGIKPESGKKYIPKLYVDREDTKSELTKKLFGDESCEPRSLLLVVGPPQHGKTCFMCNTVEFFLKQKHPVLFYPAIGLSKGLIPSIKEDFEWFYEEGLLESQWISRLNEIGKALNKRIFIFIDGWNEMIENALHLNEECHRLGLEHIGIVISTTSPSLLKLLYDQSDNPLFVAESIGGELPLFKKLVSQPLNETSRLGLVQIGKFNKTEKEQALNSYSHFFKVQFSLDDPILSDPFYLRIASELYSGRKMSTLVTRSELIEKSLSFKAKRRSIDEIDLKVKLKELADAFYLNDRPLSVIKLPNGLQKQEELLPWQESAILTLSEIPKETLVDFYYTHDLNYVISYFAREWDQKLIKNNKTDLLIEIQGALKTEVGKSALRWFLEAPENFEILKTVVDIISIEECLKENYRQIVANAIVAQSVNNQMDFQDWLLKHIKSIGADVEKGPELIYAYLMNFDWKKNQESYRFWIRLLVKYETLEYHNFMGHYFIDESFVSKVYGDELKSWGEDEYETSFDIHLFTEFLMDEDEEVAKHSAFFLAYVCPKHFLETVPYLRKYYLGRPNVLMNILNESCNLILAEKQEAYYGSMCPGWFDSLEEGDQDIKEEYYSQKKLWCPILEFLSTNDKLLNNISSHLNDLKEIAKIDGDIDFSDPNQLDIDF